MIDEHAKRLAQLRKAYMAGLLDADTYQSAVAGLKRVGHEEKSKISGTEGLNGDIIPSGQPVIDNVQALNLYCRKLVEGGRKLPFRGMDFGVDNKSCGRKQLELDHVYVELDTMPRMPDEELLPGGTADILKRGRSMGTLEAVARYPRLVVLGEPGSGKSSLLNHLVYRLASECQAPEQGLPLHSQYWPDELCGLVPIHVVLSDFAGMMPDDLKEIQYNLWDFISATLVESKVAFACNALSSVLEDGLAIVLYDGLDEVENLNQQNIVRDAVEKFSKRYHKSRHLVTCRTLSYRKSSLRLDEFPVIELAPLNRKKIDRFINLWYREQVSLGEIMEEEAASLAGRLREAVRQPGLWPLASNPLLLTIITLVHTHKGRLPDAKASLYEEIGEQLMMCGEEIRKGHAEETSCLAMLLQRAGRSHVDLKRLLWQVAFDVHRKDGAGNKEAPAHIGRQPLEKVLVMLHPEKNREWSRDIVAAIRCQTGLLLDRGNNSFSFPHRIFQEYMAGAHLAVQADFAEQATDLLSRESFWREAILLAVGRLVYLGGDTDKPLALVNRLCPEQEIDQQLAWQNARIAGDVLLEIGLSRVRDGNRGCDLLARVRSRLETLLEKGRLVPAARAEAADTLALLGDLRQGVGINDEGLPDIFWCDVEPGLFLMGSDNRRGRYDEEKPQFQCSLISQPYRISRYPVTNSQFMVFVVDGGYTDRWRHCWTADGWRWKGNRVGPEKLGGVYDLANHPKVGVNWYEAVAFCNWLSIRTGKRLSLPTEAQWERAARHNDGRLYPWGEQDEPALRCNMSETGIRSTCAVGIFPLGNAECGAADMAGNVWEWCCSKWLANYWNYEKRVDDDLAGDEPRVLRGGSFNNYGSYMRCAFRYRFGFYPPFSDRNYGFRIVELTVPSER